MSHIYHAFHIVFSTKNRAPLINQTLQKDLYEYIGGIIRKERGHLVEIGGVSDHIHILAHLHQSKAHADIIRHIKSGSSRWVNDEKRSDVHFGWQTKYGSFSVSRSNEDSVQKYIQNQEEHHRTRTFQEELRMLLKKHDIPYDERYVWE